MDACFTTGEDASRTRSPISVELPRRPPKGWSGQERWLIASHDLVSKLSRYRELLSKKHVRIILLGTTKTLHSFSIGLVLVPRLVSSHDDNEESW